MLTAVLGGFGGCRCRPSPVNAPAEAEPSLRLVLVSGIAGAIEPCGCVEDMLGGVDHAAAYLRRAGSAPRLLLGAGPMLFLDPELAPARRTQDGWKAESLLRALSDMGLAAWSPGANDFAAGPAELAKLLGKGPRLLAANLTVPGVPLERSALFSAGEIEVGVAGVSVPVQRGVLPPDAVLGDAERELARELAALREKKAELRVALVAMPRGEALRLAELVPGFQLMLVGKPVDGGEGNDPVTPPTQVGETLVVEAQNHLQSFYVVDLFVRDESFAFRSSGATDERRAELDRRIAELSASIRSAEESGKAAAIDLEARRRDRAALERDRAALPVAASPPEGSYYRVSRIEVREALGSDPAVARRLDEYYRRVNDHNRVAFADRKPAPPAEGQASYVGVAVCSTCHAEEHTFWQKTGHAGAYRTLSGQHKEFNLDCVSCHVTGYDEPGGSTVVHVDKLEDVQCEVCHGPGSRHVSRPDDRALMSKGPDRGLCAPRCHHEPHVKADWSVDAAWQHIVGPGHGG